MKSLVFESMAEPFQTKIREGIPNSKLKYVKAFQIDSDTHIFMYMTQCIKFGSWKVMHLNRALKLKTFSDIYAQ